MNFFRKYVVARQTKKLLEDILAAPHHSQYRLFLGDLDQVGPLDTASTNPTNSESRTVALLVVVIVAIWAVIQSQKQNPQGRGRSLPPGTLVNYLANFFCSPKTMHRVVNPILADMQTEYCKALAEGMKVKAFWIRLRGYWTLWKALGLYTLLKNAAEIWKLSKS